MNFIVVILCAVLALSVATAAPIQGNIRLELLPYSKSNMIAVAVRNAKVDTIAVEMLDSYDADGEWFDMVYDIELQAWIVGINEDFVYPLSFNLESKDRQHLTIEHIFDAVDNGVVDTGIQYSDPAVSHVPRKHRVTTTRAPKVTTTRRPTATTTRTPTITTARATTRAPTVTARATTTRAPTITTARAPSVTTAPVTSNVGMKLLVPLYTYPGATWTAVANGASAAKTVAVINPNSGPGNGPDSTYKTYMNTLKNAGVEMIGYVHTSYGARAWSLVKADIDKYAAEFPLVVGIFIDEAAATAAQVAYYTQVHNYIMSMPGYKYNVLNPGAVPVQAYYAISTQLVTFEVDVGKFSASANPSYANAGNKDHFVMIAYGASESQMQTAISAAKSKGYYGWVYVTDRGLTGGTYNALPSYYKQQAEYIALLNKN